MIKNWVCSVCNKRVLGKVHSGGVPVIVHKGLRLKVLGTDFRIVADCPFCGGESTFTKETKTIEDLVSGES